MENSLSDIEKSFNEILEKYSKEYLDFHNNSNSGISERNNISFFNECKESLHRELIMKSIEFNDISEKDKSIAINQSVSDFLLLNPSSKS